MLKKQYRLKTSDFQEIPGSKKLYTENFTFRFSYNNEKPLKNNVFGVIVSKKVYKKAVFRNQAKRLVYSILGQNSLINTQQPRKTFIFINKDILGQDSQKITNEVKNALK